jgi:hypothetical protein
MKITRKWAMPSKDTFTIRPIRNLIRGYVLGGTGWIDPFAGDNSPAEITNDLNPNKNTTYNLHALDFAKQLPGAYKGVLFDPPYSIRQVKECYNNIGLELFQEDAQNFPSNVRRALAPKITDLAISFGWNSQGFGKKLGFEIIEILLVAHGRNHNDTIVVVEKKLTSQGKLF